MWELFHPGFNRWVTFGKEVNGTRSYMWFGILSGVRCSEAPRVESYAACPDRACEGDTSFSKDWVEYCKLNGDDLHSHTVVPWRAVQEANRCLRDTEADEFSRSDERRDEFSRSDERRDYEVMMTFHEEVPDGNYFVEEITVDMRWDKEARHFCPILLKMGLPLGEILGSYDPEVLALSVRLVVAYDN